MKQFLSDGKYPCRNRLTPLVSDVYGFLSWMSLVASNVNLKGIRVLTEDGSTFRHHAAYCQPAHMKQYGEKLEDIELAKHVYERLQDKEEAIAITIDALTY